jgi:hypothetical protein
MARSLEAFRVGFPKRKELELPLFVDQFNGDFVAFLSPVPYSDFDGFADFTPAEEVPHIDTFCVCGGRDATLLVSV